MQGELTHPRSAFGRPPSSGSPAEPVPRLLDLTRAVNGTASLDFACALKLSRSHRPLVSMRQLLDHAAENGYELAAFSFTDPEQVADFVRRTQLDALTIAIGTSHGAYKFMRKPTGDILAIDRIKAIRRRIPNTHLVIHGSSSVPRDLLAETRHFCGDMKETQGVPVEEIQEEIKHGVRKIHIDTDVRMAMTAAIRRCMAENLGKFGPCDYLKSAREAAKKICAQRYREFGCEGQSAKIKPSTLQDVDSAYRSGKLAQTVV